MIDALFDSFDNQF